MPPRKKLQKNTDSNTTQPRASDMVYLVPVYFSNFMAYTLEPKGIARLDVPGTCYTFLESVNKSSLL